MKAFPKINRIDEDHRDGGYYVETEGGMDLRDFFAAKAMQGLLSNINVNRDNNRFAEYLKIVNDSYKIADEMMEARK